MIPIKYSQQILKKGDKGETAKCKDGMCCGTYPDGGHKTTLLSRKPKSLDVRFLVIESPWLWVLIYFNTKMFLPSSAHFKLNYLYWTTISISQSQMQNRNQKLYLTSQLFLPSLFLVLVLHLKMKHSQLNSLKIFYNQNQPIQSSITVALTSSRVFNLRNHGRWLSLKDIPIKSEVWQLKITFLIGDSTARRIFSYVWGNRDNIFNTDHNLAF